MQPQNEASRQRAPTRPGRPWRATRAVAADATARWLQGTFGDRRAMDGSLAAENFTRWFSKSHIVDEEGLPRVVFHGSGSAGGILARGFDAKLQGNGNDQYGSGFYFTTNVDTAEGYKKNRLHPELAKLGGEDSPGVLDVYLAINNPLVVDLARNPGMNCYELWPDLTHSQAHKLILAAPRVRELDGPLADWGDVRRRGFASVVASAVESYAGGSPQTLDNDLYKGQANAFLRNYNRITGHDGVIVTGRNNEIHYVAWFPEQVKSASMNGGLFDGTSPDLTDSWRGAAQVADVAGNDHAVEQAEDQAVDEDDAVSIRPRARC